MSGLGPDAYRGAHAALYDHVPFYAKRILLAGPNIAPLARVLQKRVDTLVYGVEDEAETIDAARSALDTRLYPDIPALVAQCAAIAFDRVLLINPDMDGGAFSAVLQAVKPVLGPHGSVVVLAANPGYWERSLDESVPVLERIGDAARVEDFHTYRIDTVDDAAFLRAAKDAGGGAFRVGEREFSAADAEQILNLACRDYILEFVRPDYNPIEHAHDLLEGGDPGGSYEVLDAIPAAYRSDPTTFAVINTEMLLCLMRWQQQDPELRRLHTLARAQRLFHGAVQREPEFVPAYRCHAELWRQAGDPDMARRLLRTILHVAPDADARMQLDSIVAAAPTVPADAAPIWRPDPAPTRILFIMHPRPHFGLDVLYDGLCRVLGAEAVTEYPWKPTLHGAAPEEHKYYPCNFDWPGEGLDEAAVLDALRAGAYDIVLWGDCEAALPEESAKAIAKAAGDLPIYIVDQLDEFIGFREVVEARIGRTTQGYFKREMLLCADYGADAYPLPFAYPENHVPASPLVDRPQEFFWAGHRLLGLRQLYLERLEAILEQQFSDTFEQAEYAARLGGARMGLNLFGFGFDTVRYWELPAHGTLLLAERLPIRVPYNFEDGVSAVFFDDLPDLERRLQELRNDPDTVQRIAAAGRAHFLAHHTGSARAKQLLGWIQFESSKTPR